MQGDAIEEDRCRLNLDKYCQSVALARYMAGEASRDSEQQFRGLVTTIGGQKFLSRANRGSGATELEQLIRTITRLRTRLYLNSNFDVNRRTGAALANRLVCFKALYRSVSQTVSVSVQQCLRVSGQQTFRSRQGPVDTVYPLDCNQTYLECILDGMLLDSIQLIVSSQ